MIILEIKFPVKQIMIVIIRYRVTPAITIRHEYAKIFGIILRIYFFSSFAKTARAGSLAGIVLFLMPDQISGFIPLGFHDNFTNQAKPQ